MVKVNRWPESNEDSINAKPEGKTKISSPISLPRSLVDIA
jgi:hypothetical protein